MCCPKSRDTPQAHSLPPRSRMPLSYLLSPQLQGLLPSLNFCPHLDSYFAKKKRKTRREHPHAPATGPQALAQPVPGLRLLLSDSLSRSTNGTPSPSLLVCSTQKPGATPSLLALTVLLCPATPRQVLWVASSDYIHRLCTACHLH